MTEYRVPGAYLYGFVTIKMLENICNEDMGYINVGIRIS